MPFDRQLVERHLLGLRALGRFFPFGEAREQPFLRAFGPLHMGREHLRPGPAQARQRLKSRPGAVTFGPVGAFADLHHPRCGELQQQRHFVVAVRHGEVERFGQSLRRGHAETGRAHESEQLQKIEARQVGIAEAIGHQRGVQQQQRRVGSRHHRLALGTAARAAVGIAQPCACVAGMDRGEGQRLAHRSAIPSRERKVNRGARKRFPTGAEFARSGGMNRHRAMPRALRPASVVAARCGLSKPEGHSGLAGADGKRLNRKSKIRGTRRLTTFKRVNAPPPIGALRTCNTAVHPRKPRS